MVGGVGEGEGDGGAETGYATACYDDFQVERRIRHYDEVEMIWDEETLK